MTSFNGDTVNNFKEIGEALQLPIQTRKGPPETKLGNLLEQRGTGVTSPTRDIAIAVSPKKKKNSFTIPQPPSSDPPPEVQAGVRLVDSTMDLKRLCGYLKERKVVFENQDKKRDKRKSSKSPRHRSKSPKVKNPEQETFIFKLDVNKQNNPDDSDDMDEGLDFTPLSDVLDLEESRAVTTQIISESFSYLNDMTNSLITVDKLISPRPGDESNLNDSNVVGFGGVSSIDPSSPKYSESSPKYATSPGGYSTPAGSPPASANDAANYFATENEKMDGRKGD